MMSSDETLYYAVTSIVNTGRIVDPAKWSVSDALAKLLEEAGELSEAAQHKMGRIDKGLPEGAEFEECADTIMCAIDVLSQSNLDMSLEDLIHKLSMSIINKIPKWNRKIHEKGFNRANA